MLVTTREKSSTKDRGELNEDDDLTPAQLDEIYGEPDSE